VQMGDEVVLFGKQGAAEITQTELEDISGTILVELYTLWGRVNPRVLVK
jgi:alanine racemase